MFLSERKMIKKKKRHFVLFLLAALFLRPVFAAEPVYTTIEDVRGSVEFFDEEGAISTFAIIHTILAPLSEASRGGFQVGDAHHGVFKITKKIDRTSPQLFEKMTEGEVLYKAVINFYDNEERYYSVTLQNVYIVNVTTYSPLTLLGENSEYKYLEDVSFAYSSIGWEADIIEPSRRTEPENETEGPRNETVIVNELQAQTEEINNTVSKYSSVMGPLLPFAVGINLTDTKERAVIKITKSGVEVDYEIGEVDMDCSTEYETLTSLLKITSAEDAKAVLTENPVKCTSSGIRGEIIINAINEILGGDYIEIAGQGIISRFVRRIVSVAIKTATALAKIVINLFDWIMSLIGK